jgi:hypothetical protein
MSTSDTEVGQNPSEIVRSFITTWNEHDINAACSAASRAARGLGSFLRRD